MNIKPENEITSEEDINLYECWKVLVKRKKILIGIFLVPLVIVTIVSLSLPRSYRGESEISIPALPAPNITSVITGPNIVRLIGNIDDTLKVKILPNNPDAIKSVSVSLPKGSNDKVEIIIDAKTADIIPQVFQNVLDYIKNLPELKGEIAKIQADNDLKIKKIVEIRKANINYLNLITDNMKKKAIVSVNPADLLKKDADLSIEITNLQKAEWKYVMLGPLSITKQPSNSKVKQIIIITGIISLFIGIFVVFILDYIDRIKARENELITPNSKES